MPKNDFTRKILTPLQKLPKNVRDLGKIIVVTGLGKVPKVQQITQSGHTTSHQHSAHPRMLLQQFNTLSPSMGDFNVGKEE